MARMEECLGLAVDRVKVVANAGGLNPAGLAAELRALAGKLGIDVSVAHVAEGDDLLGRLGELQAEGEPLAHLDARDAAGRGRGGAGHRQRLPGRLGDRGRPGGQQHGGLRRVTDACLVVGPAAWRLWPS